MALTLIGSGMVSAVGYSSPASCAAIRCGLNRFEETRFKFAGEFLVGSMVPLPGEPRGAERQLLMAAMALDECLAQLPAGEAGDTAWVVCLGDPHRPGRPRGLDELFVAQLHDQLEHPDRLGPHSQLLSGDLSPVHALPWLQQTIAAGRATYGIVLAVDSYLKRATLAHFHGQGRLLGMGSSDGFVPGEAAGAIAVCAARGAVGELQCLGIGRGLEPATPGSARPLTGEGLAAAFRKALSRAGLSQTGCGLAHIDYRIADLSGEQHGFKEAALALARVMRVRKAQLDLWHPAQSTGQVGPAMIPIALALALHASRVGYAPGPGALLHFGADDGERAALVLREFGRQSLPPLD